jgi:hypothetical protein
MMVKDLHQGKERRHLKPLKSKKEWIKVVNQVKENKIEL